VPEGCVQVVASDVDEVKSQQGAKEKAVKICVDQLQRTVINEKEFEQYTNKKLHINLDHLQHQLKEFII
jgi:hypothetical protein